VGARLAALLLITALPAAAQSVRGQLTDSVSRAPLPGAFLTLVDDHGVEQARAITNRGGEFLLTAPAPGTYRLRSKRIGFRPYLSPALTLRAGEATAYSAAIDPIPIALEEVVVAGERQCDIDSGASVAALWDETREALAAVSWTSRIPGYWYEIVQYQRALNAGGNRQVGSDDSTWHEVGYQRVPFKSAPAEQLAAQGYVVVDADGWTYYEPDAEVLLSDAFLHTHCFETRIGRGETDGLVGLAFSPARGRKLPDITGTLWIDRRTAELRHLEFSYTRLPERVVEPRAGGRVDFQRMPSGVWIVKEWVIRMPIAERRRRSVTEGGGESLPTVVGFLERGGNAAEIKTKTGALVYRGPGVDTATAPPPPPPPPPAPPRAPPAIVPTGAAATGPAPETKRRRAGSGDVLSEDEFVGTSATDAYGLVQQYRPNWLRGRGPLSITDPTAGDIQIYINSSRWGDANHLHEIPAQDVVEMRILRGPDATMKYGVNHAAGVIEVITR